jgi:transcriptional regulator with XRE-family HTH domain
VGIARLIAARRTELGITQAELAEALNVVSGRPTLTQHDVSRWERGTVTPRNWLPYLATVLELPVARLRLAGRDEGALPPDVARVALDWLVVEAPQVTERRGGRRIGSGLVAQVRDRVAELRRLDDHLAGGDTHALVSRELAATLRLTEDSSYTEDTGRELFAAIAELAQLAGWVTSDAGMPRKATTYYLTGVDAATRAGDSAGAASNLSSLAYQTANVGAPLDAVTLARAAVSGADGAPPKVRALLCERVAWAHARAGQRHETERALGEVDELLDTGSGDEAAWLYWLDRREADVMAGRCYAELHRPLRAVPLLEQATAGYRDDAPRELSLYLSWLAVAYADASELDAACRTAHRMIGLSKNVSSARIRERLDGVVRRLRKFGDEPQVRELVAAAHRTERPGHR